MLHVMEFGSKITDVKNSPRTLMTIFQMSIKIISESEAIRNYSI